MNERSKKTLWLIRHGQTAYNAEAKIQGSGIDAPLNDLGHLQAKHVAHELAKRVQTTSCTLFASSMQRAYQTAEPIAKELQLEIHSTSALIEMNYGKFEGQEFEKVEKDLKNLLNQWAQGKTQQAPDGGESPKEVLYRADAFIQQQLEESDSTDLIMVAHGRVIRVLLSHYLFGDLKYMHKIHHQNANINALYWENAAFEIRSINETGHLID